MKMVKGHYDGSVVILDDPAPIPCGAEVIVQIPDADPSPTGTLPADLRWYWDNAKAVAARFAAMADAPDLIARGITPSGLPREMPSDEEWQRRAKEAVRLMRQWQEEEPSEDLATWEELRAGLEASPVQFHEWKLNE